MSFEGRCQALGMLCAPPYRHLKFLRCRERRDLSRFLLLAQSRVLTLVALPTAQPDNVFQPTETFL